MMIKSSIIWYGYVIASLQNIVLLYSVSNLDNIGNDAITLAQNINKALV